MPPKLAVCCDEDTGLGGNFLPEGNSEIFNNVGNQGDEDISMLKHKASSNMIDGYSNDNLEQRRKEQRINTILNSLRSINLDNNISVNEIITQSSGSNVFYEITKVTKKLKALYKTLHYEYIDTGYVKI